MDKMGIVLSEARPSVPGCDFAGIIHSAGKESRWTVGQEVHGMTMAMEGPLLLHTISLGVVEADRGRERDITRIPQNPSLIRNLAQTI